MIKLEVVIQNLSEKDYSSLVNQFEKTKGDKFVRLLGFLKAGNISDNEMIEKLNVTKSAFYTLKSRLAEKIQEHLFKNVDDHRIELLRNVSNIHNLIYNTPRETAIAMLVKMETELKENDLPNELTSVYSALKKLHLHTPKYFEYSQQYNKHIAFTIAIEKAEDLLSDFSKTLGEYEIWRDNNIAIKLALIKKEMQNICRLNESHHLRIYKHLVSISFALFVPLSDEIKDDDSVEEMLTASYKIFDTYDKDGNYKYLRNVFDYLSFEYYHALKLYKNEAPYFEKVNSNLTAFLLSGHCSFNTRFLKSKIERYILLGEENKLTEEIKSFNHEVVAADVPNYINLNIYKAACAYYSKKYSEAAKILYEILQGVNFRNVFHAETEVKLFLALCFSMCNKYDQTESTLRSVSRKIADNLEEGSYENASTFVKMLKLQMTSEIKNMEEKFIKHRNEFLKQNIGTERMLGFIKLDDVFLKEFSKGVK